MSCRRLASIALLGLLSMACDGKTQGGSSQAPKAEGSACSSGDAEVREAWMLDLRRARQGSDEAEAKAQLETLSATCESDRCALACLEYARFSTSHDEAQAYNQRACDAGETLGCELSRAPTADKATLVCEGGEWQGCAASIALGGQASGGWEALQTSAHAACERVEARACAVAAWARCGGLGECDAEAVADAERAMGPGSSEAVALNHGLISCHAGEARAADTSLEASCEAGRSSSCGRRCETLMEEPVLVLEAERARVEHIMLLLALSPDAQDGWVPVVSTMDAKALAGFERMMEAFTPPLTEAGLAAKVSPTLREHHPIMVEALMRAPQVDAKKLKYWFGRLEAMDEEQRGNLLESLRKQWWIIPGDPTQTPETFIAHARLEAGGLASAWAP